MSRRMAGQALPEVNGSIIRPDCDGDKSRTSADSGEKKPIRLGWVLLFIVQLRVSFALHTLHFFYHCAIRADERGKIHAQAVEENFLDVDHFFIPLMRSMLAATR